MQNSLEEGPHEIKLIAAVHAHVCITTPEDCCVDTTNCILEAIKPAIDGVVACRKRRYFLNFSYVCPEPVLA